MKKTIIIVSAAAIGAMTLLGASAQARPHHHNDGAGVSLRIGPGGAALIVEKDRHEHRRYERRRHNGHALGVRKERRDVIQARRRLEREQRQLDRAIASGDRFRIRQEREDVREARRALRRERRDL